MAKSYQQLVGTIRNSSSTSDDKKEAAAAIALRLLRNQAAGGQLLDINAKFNTAGPENFNDLVAKIQSSIETL